MFHIHPPAFDAIVHNAQQAITLDLLQQALKDVSCQTSDCEVFYKKDLIALEQRQRDMADIRKLAFDQATQREAQVDSVR